MGQDQDVPSQVPRNRTATDKGTNQPVDLQIMSSLSRTHTTASNSSAAHWLARPEQGKHKTHPEVLGHHLACSRGCSKAQNPLQGIVPGDVRHCTDPSPRTRGTGEGGPQARPRGNPCSSGDNDGLHLRDKATPGLGHLACARAPRPGGHRLLSKLPAGNQGRDAAAASTRAPGEEEEASGEGFPPDGKDTSARAATASSPRSSLPTLPAGRPPSAPAWCPGLTSSFMDGSVGPGTAQPRRSRPAARFPRAPAGRQAGRQAGGRASEERGERTGLLRARTRETLPLTPGC